MVEDVSVDGEKCPLVSQNQRCQLQIPCVVQLPVNNPKTYNDKPYIWEAGTRECLAFWQIAYMIQWFLSINFDYFGTFHKNIYWIKIGVI